MFWTKRSKDKKKKSKNEQAFDLEKEVIGTGHIIISHSVPYKSGNCGVMELIGIDYEKEEVYYYRGPRGYSTGSPCVLINGIKVNLLIVCDEDILYIKHNKVYRNKALKMPLYKFIAGYIGSFDLYVEKMRMQRQLKLDECKMLEERFKGNLPDELETKIYVFERIFNTSQLTVEQKQILLDKMTTLLNSADFSK